MEFCSTLHGFNVPPNSGTPPLLLPPNARDRLPPLSPMPAASNGLIALPPLLAAKTEERVFTLLEAILGEQAGLRGVIGQLEAGLCKKLDDLDKSVASCNSGGFQTMAVDNAWAEEEEAKELVIEAQKWFNKLDKDKNGVLSKVELKSLLKTWSMTAKSAFKEQLNLESEEDIDRLVEAADKNCSGDIDGDEFLDLITIRKVEVHNPPAPTKLPHGFSNVFADEHRPISFVEKVVTSAYFECIAIGVICVNMVIMCTSLQFKGMDSGSKIGMRDYDNSWATHEVRFRFIDIVFNAVYLIELILRLWVAVLQRRFSASAFMDTLIVVISCLDSFILQPMNIKFINVAVLRLARLAKLSKFFKALQYSESLSAVRVLLNTLVAAVKGIIWSVILLGSIIAAGGVLMTQLAIPFLQDDSIDLKTRQWIYTYFGTTTTSMYTMFESTFSGGWRIFARPLIEEVHYGFAAFWIAWVILVNFVTMRVVGALFLQQTMRVAVQDGEKCAMNQLKRKGHLSESLRQIFKAADSSGDGAMNQEEFDQMMSHESVVKEFAHLGLDIDEVGQFFSVLCADDGNADYNEFINGALAMATSAPAVDMMKTLQHEIKIETGLQQILEVVKAMERVVSPKRKTA